MTQRKGFAHGSSIAAILCGLGPRIALAPPDEGGTGGAAAGEGGGAAATPAAAPTPAASEGAPSALAAGVAKVAEAAAAPAGGEAAKPPEAAKGEVKPPAEAKPGDPAQPPADAIKDVDGNPLPEKYEIKMPDGVEMDKALYDQAAPVFRDLKLSPAQAQGVTDIYAKVQGDAIAKHNDMVNGWIERAKTDPQFGGAKFDENVGKASQAFNTFGNEEAMQVLDTYGLGNHPAILRMFANVGNAMGEGATILPGAGTGRVSDAQAMYPSMTK